MSDPGQPAEPRSVRLIFEYEGDQVRLVHQQPVDVAISGFDLPQEQLAGDHVEVRGVDERLLSRVPIRSAMTTSREVFPENPADPIVRTDLPQAQGAFTVVVPAPAEAHHVTVVRIAARPSEPGPGVIGPPPEVTELGSFPLGGGEPR
jgi:hypothetical protein